MIRSNGSSKTSISSKSSSSPHKARLVQARPHLFSGAVLTLNQARELTPSLVLLVCCGLSERVLEGHPIGAAQANIADSPRSAFSQASADTAHRPQRFKVQYTVWITQAWHVLKWGEPSASLFWEMCTMFHTLFLAERSTQEPAKFVQTRNAKLYFPAFPAVEPSSSVDSQDGTKREKSGRNTPESPGDSSCASSPLSSRVKALSTPYTPHLQTQALPAGTAKELPIWMIGMFLLMHCEDQVFFRCITGGRFAASSAPSDLNNHSSSLLPMTTDLWNMNSTLSPRTRMHAGHITDATRCASFLLRHLRKFLLLTAVPHNAEALAALMKLSVAASQKDSEFLSHRSARIEEKSLKTGAPNYNSTSTTPLFSPVRTNTLLSSNAKNISTSSQQSYDVHSIQSLHQEEHGETGLHIRLSKEDLDRLHLILESPFGGFMDDPPLDVTDIIPHTTLADLAAYGGVLLEDVEKEIKRHLIEEIVQYNQDHKDQALSQIINDFQSISLTPMIGNDAASTLSSPSHDTQTNITEEHIARQLKSLRIANCHHSTMLRKPNAHKEIGSHPQSLSTHGMTLSIPNYSVAPPYHGRLHDVSIHACSDSHIYLLQPLEHVTISGCTDCTIVVGAIAGLLHVVDCERTKITVAARRIVVSNCSDVVHYLFTPNKPLLVGDNRSCQFAPHNTYYDGLREDLLATALAAMKVNPQENDHILSTMSVQHMLVSKNMWKNPEDLTKIEMSQTVSQHSQTASAVGILNTGVDGTLSPTRSSDDMMQTPILLPPNEFHIISVPVSGSVPIESSLMDDTRINGKGGESPYCRLIADVLSLSPLRLPVEYERQALAKVEKVRALHQAMTCLSLEQQVILEEDLNRMFRDWLVNSGNLRQILDLVHMIGLTNSVIVDSIMTTNDEAKQLDSVTDMVQGKELDEMRTRDAMSTLSSSSAVSVTSDIKLSSVEVSKKDIEFIVNELEITDEAAERTLKQVIVDGVPEGQTALTCALMRLLTS